MLIDIPYRVTSDELMLGNYLIFYVENNPTGDIVTARKIAKDVVECELEDGSTKEIPTRNLYSIPLYDEIFLAFGFKRINDDEESLPEYYYCYDKDFKIDTSYCDGPLYEFRYNDNSFVGIESVHQIQNLLKNVKCENNNLRCDITRLSELTRHLYNEENYISEWRKQREVENKDFK